MIQERGRQKRKRLWLCGFGQLFRSLSLNSYGYSPQMIEKPDQNHCASRARFLPPTLLAESAKKQLSKLDRTTAKRITTFLRERIADSQDPRSCGKALTGPLGSLWRYRVGDYRIICDIQDNALRVLVVKIGNRRDVYR